MSFHLVGCIYYYDHMHDVYTKMSTSYNLIGTEYFMHAEQDALLQFPRTLLICNSIIASRVTRNGCGM